MQACRSGSWSTSTIVARRSVARSASALPGYASSIHTNGLIYGVSKSLIKHFGYTGEGLFDIIVCRHPVTNGDAHNSHSLPRCTAEPGNPIELNTPNYFVSGTIV